MKRPAASREHFVQFYEQDDFLIAEVGRFLATCRRDGYAGIAIVAPQHRALLEQRLNDTVARRDRCIVLDAAATLSEVMIDGWPDEQRFQGILGSVIRRASQDGSRQVRVFGEMDSLLWAEGRHKAAFQMEEMWNHLAELHSFSMFCAYPMARFHEARHRGSFLRICHSHTRVCPAESFPRNGDPLELQRQVALLQQQAGALETEVAKRARLVKLLQELGHELRNPLTGQTELMARLVDDLLGLARGLD